MSYNYVKYMIILDFSNYCQTMHQLIEYPFNQLPLSPELEIVDYMQYFGISIDRDYNETKGNHKQTKTKEDYMALIPEIIEWGDELKLLLQLIVRIETPVKLNLINSDGESSIKNEEMGIPEVHYL